MDYESSFDTLLGEDLLGEDLYEEEVLESDDLLELDEMELDDYELGFPPSDALGIYEEDYQTPGGGTYAPGRVNRRSKAYIRWVQQSLNRVNRAGLAVDGINGANTRRAVRNFQRRAGLAVDGVVGARTEAALVRAGATPPTGGGSAPTPSPTPTPGTRPPTGRASLATLNAFSRWFLQDYMRRGINLDCADLAIELWIHYGDRYGVPVSFEFWDSRGRRWLVANRQGVRAKFSSAYIRRFSSLTDFVRYVQGNVNARGLIRNTVPVPGQHRAAVAGDVFLWQYRSKTTGKMYHMGHTQILFDFRRAGNPMDDTIRVVQGNYPAIPPEFRTNRADYFYTEHDTLLSAGPHVRLPVLPAPRRFKSFQHLR